MLKVKKNGVMPKHNKLLRSEEVQELISNKPEWIVRYGVALMGGLILILIGASALIQYPEIVKTSLKINSLNAPKAILAKQGGKLSKLLVQDGQQVNENQVLAYFESTANPDDVLKLSAQLKKIQEIQFKPNQSTPIELPVNLNLGEMQSSYQSFYQEYLQYQLTQKNGFYLKKMGFLDRDMRDITALKKQIIKQQQIQQQEYSNAENEYKAYKQLYDKKVISRSEFAQQENKFLSAKYPLQQTETSILNNSASYNAKEKELAELQNVIGQQQAKFLQALNQCITECEAWIVQHVLKSSVSGKLSFAGIVQQNQNIVTNQEVFIINPGNTNFFGEIQIPQYNMGKIQIGQRTLVKLHGYPFEQYGLIKGKLSYVSDVAYRDSVFIAKVSFHDFENKNNERKIVLKNGMQGDAEIITEESSLLQRFFRNMTKMLNTNG
jgi:multidrug efflux pump subunit AcrA (membrane-fusion protein)